jgi:O-acetyl-ADP-ribose deacetylase (regulator of RNase III)/hexokinase
VKDEENKRPTSRTAPGGGRLVLVKGDITEQAVDAIVNAANPSLLGGGGVDGAIHRKGGLSILEECRRIRQGQGGCPPGQAVLTGGGKLPARHVIHAVGPVWHGGLAGEEGILSSAYRSSLRLARAQGFSSVALPSISTGAYGYPVQEAARVALEAAWAEIQAGGLREVRFVLFSQADFEVYRQALENPSFIPGWDLDPERCPAAANGLRRRLVEDRVILDLGEARVVESLRRDVERIAEGMERESEVPPMLWTGIPFPQSPANLDSNFCLVVSVGGTKTEYALMRLEAGEAHILDLEGRDVSGPDVGKVKKTLRFPTPTETDTRTGHEMIEKIVEQIAAHLEPHKECLESCRSILLSWGFAHKVMRTGPRVLGGVSARTTLMTKEQSSFTKDLGGEDLGLIMRRAFQERLGWSAPVTVANDGIMALHYFLTAENLSSHARFGLFINGTGTNFAAAEPYAVRQEGVVSAPGEDYHPERITRYRALRAGEKLERYFVNYETGSIDLAATRTPFDLEREYPIENNALAGGNAFEQQFREIVRARISADLHDRLLAAWRERSPEIPAPRGPEVSRIATAGPSAVGEVFPGAVLDADTAEKICLVCRAIVARSALHAALILAAVTRRTGFGLGDPAAGRPDLLAMEGSVWRTLGYPALVRNLWQALAGAPLSVNLVHEKGFDASLPGPVYLAVLQR